MKKKEFYNVLLPLINNILTGNSSIDFKRKLIPLSIAFTDSLTANTTSPYNVHFFDCIQSYFKNLSEEEIIPLTKFFVENHLLLSMAVMPRDSKIVTKQSTAYYNDELTLILLDFIDQTTIDYTLQLTLYLYLENIVQIKIDQQTISFETYHKVLDYNSKQRTKAGIINRILQ